MVTLKPGDTVTCKFKNGSVVSSYSGDFDEKLSFEIIGLDNRGYYIYIPHYIYLKNTHTVTKSTTDSFNIKNKFIGEQILYITDNNVCSVKRGLDGAECRKCHEFYPFSKPDADGKIICWTCRNYKIYK